MANNSIPAVYGLNQFLWNYLSDNTTGILLSADYQGLIPIIPNGEAPQFLQMLDEQAGIQSKPYIVYTWYTNGFDANSWYKPTDTILYTVYAMDQNKLNDIVMSTVNVFKRYDVSAVEINEYIQSNYITGFNQATHEANDPVTEAQYKAYNYNYTYVAAATGGVAPDIENDPISATITVRVNYTNPVVDLPLA